MNKEERKKKERGGEGRRRRRKLERGENSKSFHAFVTSLVISYTRKLSPRISANHPSSFSLSLSLMALFLAILNREYHSRGGARGLKGSSTNEFMKYPSSVRIYYFRAVSLTFRFYARGEKGWDWSLGSLFDRRRWPIVQ